MINRSYAIITGAFVATMIAALVGIAAWLSGYHTMRTTYILVSPHSVAGLGPQAAVYYRGVPVGSVDSVTFERQPPHDVLVRIGIDPGVPVTRGTYASLQPRGITGVVDVELDGSGTTLPPLATSASAPARIPLHRSEFTALLASGKVLLARLTRLTGDLDRFASSDNRAQVARILANTSSATRQLALDEKQLHAVLASLPDLSRQARHTLNNVDTVAAHVDVLSTSLDRLARDTDATDRAVGRTTLPDLDALLTRLRTTGAQLQQLVTMIKHDPQSLLYGHSPAPGPGEPGYRP